MRDAKNTAGAAPGAWLYDAEYSLMELVWENAPVGSTRLAALAAGQLGWKKSTTYTVLRKLAGRGVLENKDATVRPLITRQQALRAQAAPVLARCGGLSGFLTAFFDGAPLPDAEADRLQALIDASRARRKEGVAGPEDAPGLPAGNSAAAASQPEAALQEHNGSGRRTAQSPALNEQPGPDRGRAVYGDTAVQGHED